MPIISGMTCQNGTALQLTAPASVDASIVNIYNTGETWAYLSGNLALIPSSSTVGGTLGLRSLVDNSTSFIWNSGGNTISVSGAISAGTTITASGQINCGYFVSDNGATINGTTTVQNVVASNNITAATINSGGLTSSGDIVSTTGHGIYVKNPGNTANVISLTSDGVLAVNGNGSYSIVSKANNLIQGGGVYVQSANGSANIGYIDNTGTIGCKGIYVKNPDDTANLGYIDSSGNLTVPNVVANNNITAASATINGTTVFNGTSYIYKHDLVVQGGGIVIQPSSDGQAASGLYIQTPVGINQAYIDVNGDALFNGNLTALGTTKVKTLSLLSQTTDTADVLIYNTGGYNAVINGNLSLGNGVNSGNLTALGITSNANNFIRGGGLYVQAPGGTANYAFIDSFGSIYSTTAGGGGGLFVLNSANALLGYIDSQGSIFTTSAGGGGGLYVRNSTNTDNLARIDNAGTIYTRSGLYVQNSAGTANLGYIDNAGFLSAQNAQINGNLTVTSYISAGLGITSSGITSSGDIVSTTGHGIYVKNPGNTANVISLTSDGVLAVNGNGSYSIVSKANNLIQGGGVYVQSANGSANLGFIDNTGTIGCKGVYVQNPAGTANLGYIDSSGNLTVPTATVSNLFSPTGWSLAPLAFGLINGTGFSGYNIKSAYIPQPDQYSIVTIYTTNITVLYAIVTLYGLDESFPKSSIYVYTYAIGNGESTITVIMKNSNGGAVVYPYNIVVFGN